MWSARRFDARSSFYSVCALEYGLMVGVGEMVWPSQPLGSLCLVTQHGDARLLNCAYSPQVCFSLFVACHKERVIEDDEIC